MNWFALLRLLLLAAQFVEEMLLKAAEQKKAGNLLEIQAAVSDLKTAKSEEDKDAAVRKIQAAFKAR